jgi:hypothetical protein
MRYWPRSSERGPFDAVTRIRQRLEERAGMGKRMGALDYCLLSSKIYGLRRLV